MIIERSLIYYIERALSIGFSREKIEWSLFEVGWPLRTIKRAYHITRIVRSAKVTGHAFRVATQGLIRSIINYRTYALQTGEMLSAYTLFVRDGVENTIKETRAWLRGIKTRIATRRENLARPARRASVQKFKEASISKNSTHSISSAPAPRTRHLQLKIARLHYPQFSLFTKFSGQWSRLRERGVSIFEHSIKERFTSTEQEVFGFIGFLVSNTLRGIEEFLYDIFRILIVIPFLFIKRLAMRIVPHATLALPSVPVEARHIPRGFEYHGVSLPGHIRSIDIIELSSRMFRTRRMRTFLTVLGISIGIGTILFLVSLGYGLQNIIFERIATTESLLTLDVTTGEKEIISLDRSAVERMALLPNVTEVSPLASINGQVSIADLSANIQIRGISTSYFNLGGIRPSAGRIFEEGERDKVVVSLAVMRLFNITNPEDIIGKQAQFNLLFANEEIGDTEVTRLGTTYEIVGILDDAETSYVYLPLASLEQFNIATYSQVKIKIANEQNAEAIRSEIIGMGFFVSAVSDILDQATKIFQAIQIVLAVFGLVALVVSAIGMFNTMTIALLERTQEIGIMKALGATPRDIWLMFLSESVIMGFLGGVGGILTGIIGAEIFNIGIGLLANAVGASSTDLFQRPLWFIITIAVFSTLIGFITGLWPAHRASKLNTLAALRYK